MKIVCVKVLDFVLNNMVCQGTIPQRYTASFICGVYTGHIDPEARFIFGCAEASEKVF